MAECTNKGDLSKVSLGDDDQRIPATPPSKLTADSTDQRGIKRVKSSKMIVEGTVTSELIDSYNNGENIVRKTPRLSTYASSRSTKQKNSSVVAEGDQEKKNSLTRKQEVYHKVLNLYAHGARSPLLLKVLNESRTRSLPMRLVYASAEYLKRMWEAERWEAERRGEVLDDTNALGMTLTHYMAQILHHIAPSPVTLFCATHLIGRLRQLYPTAKGERGCCHRLLTTALMICHRYFEFASPIDSSHYQRWSLSTGQLFSPSELVVMEMEMISFLNFEIHISWDDLEYFVERVYNTNSGQVVPRCLDMVDMTRPIGAHNIVDQEASDEDAIVPSA